MCAGLARLLVDAFVVSRSLRGLRKIVQERMVRYKGLVQPRAKMVARVVKGRVQSRKGWMKEAGRKDAG